MYIAKLKMVLTVVVAFGLVAGGVTALVQHAGAADQTPTTQPVAPVVAEAPAKVQAAAEQPAAKAEQPPPKSTPEGFWADLGSTDEGKVFHAILGLAATPKETIAFFKENLRPVAVDNERVKKLIADLDSDNFAARQKAEEELEYLNKYVRVQLRKAVKDNPPLEVKQRLDKLIKKLPYDALDEIADLYEQFQKDPNNQNVRNKLIVALQGGSGGIYTTNAKLAIQADAFGQAMPQPRQAAKTTPPLWLRAKRAVAVLEHLKTPEAKQLLEALAQGEAEALPTIEAKAALERMSKP